MSHDELHPDQIIAIQLTGNTGKRFGYEQLCEPTPEPIQPQAVYPMNEPTPYPFRQGPRIYASPTLIVVVREGGIQIVSGHGGTQIAYASPHEIGPLVEALATAAGLIAIAHARRESTP